MSNGTWNDNPLTRLLGVRYPIIQAPMGGGPSTPALVAAVSNAGGLGSLAGGYQTPEQLRADIRATRLLTTAPFAVNLFAEERPAIDAEAIARSQAALEPFREEVGLARKAPMPSHLAESFDAQFAVVAEERVPIFSFTFGIPEVLSRCRALGIVTIGTATHPAEAIALERAGVDVVCAQGSEAGAHRGTFIGEAEDALIGTIALVPLIADAVSLPVIAAGGIMDGRGIAAAMMLGARGVQLGTAFLRTPESGASETYKRALSLARPTAITRAFSGKAARGISNRMLRTLAGAGVPAYPIQNALTRELRTAAAKAGNSELLSLWAGQGVPLVRDIPAGDLLATLVRETEVVLAR